MKKKHNHLLTVILLLITALMFAFYFAKNINQIKKKYYTAKKEVEDFLGIETSPAQDFYSSSDTVKTPLTGYSYFEAFNKNFHKKMEDELDGGTYRELDKNLKELYKSAKKHAENDDRDYNLSLITKKSISFKVTNVTLTKNKEDIPIPEDSVRGISTSKNFHDENGDLKEGYSYCIVELQVTNTGETDIAEIYTNPAMEIFFMDNAGEVYYRSMNTLFASFQPGEGTKLYRLENFKKGDSYKSSYVMAIYDSGLEYFDPCFVVCPPGNGAYPASGSTMVILDSLKK